MELDAVELVMAVEEEFGIEIPDVVRETLTTPRQVAEYVLSLQSDEPAGNHPQAAFYHLRGALARVAGVKRRDLRPDTRLAEILPRWRIRELWSRLGHAIDATAMPRLRAPRQVKVWLILATVALALLMAWCRMPRDGYFQACLALLVADYMLLEQFSTLVPPSAETVSALVPYVTLPVREAGNFDEVLQRVMRITAEQSGAKPGSFGPDTCFVAG